MLVVNIIDLITKLFDGLYDASIWLYDFIAMPLGAQLADFPFIKNLANFAILGWQPFEWVVNNIVNLLPFSILESIPLFIGIGIIASIIKHILPLS